MIKFKTKSGHELIVSISEIVELFHSTRPLIYTKGTDEAWYIINSKEQTEITQETYNKIAEILERFYKKNFFEIN